MTGTNSNVRAWIAAILGWAHDNGLSIDRFCNVDIAVNLHYGKLYISSHDPESWRLTTLRNGSLDDHTVVTETPDRRVRVRRGPVCRLVDVRYSPAANDAQKLADASRSIAELIADEPLRHDFLGRFIGDEVL